jgi:hypothetical protein
VTTQSYFQRRREVHPEILKKLDIFSFTVSILRSGDRSRIAELPKQARAAAAEIGYARMLDQFQRPEVEPRFMELYMGMGGFV